MNRKKLKTLVLACSVLVSLGAVSSASYAGIKTGPADSDSALGYYSVGDLIKTNDFDNGAAAPWKFMTYKPSVNDSFAEADSNVENGKYNIKISNPGKESFDVMTEHAGLTLEEGHTYTVTFDVTSDEDCSIYAKVGDEGDPYNEYWNNNWCAFKVTKGETTPVNQTFTMNSSKDNCALMFYLGGSYGSSTCPYTVSIDNVHLYDEQFKGYPIEKSMINNAVKVNQGGYYADTQKTAIVNSKSSSPIQWKLLNSYGCEVTSGMTTVKGKDSASGENIHVIDFSKYRLAGKDYKIEIDDNNDSDQYYSNQSLPFSISKETNLYGNLAYNSLKYFYLNRGGMLIKMPYCDDSALARNAAYINDITYCPENPFFYNTSDYNKVNMTGGWLDGSKNRKYVSENSFAVWMLQNKYENALKTKSDTASNALYSDNSLNIPESGDGYPDILNEARFNTESLLNMQLPDGYGDQYSGMVFNNVEPLTYSFTGVCNGRHFAQPSTNATLDFAAVTAQSARLWTQYDSDFADKCLIAAKKAWDAAVENPDILMPVNNEEENTNYSDANVDDDFYWAACELYASTGDEKYLDYMKSSKYYLTMPVTLNRDDDIISGTFDCNNVQGLGTLTLVSSDNKLDDTELTKAKDNILEAADKLLDNENTEGYGIPIKQSSLNNNSITGYPYDSNLYISNAAITLAYADEIAHEQGNAAADNYLQGAYNSLDYLLGKNAENKSYVTSYGSNFVEHPYYTVGEDYLGISDEDTEINKEISYPGWMVSGPNSEVNNDKALNNYGFNQGGTAAQKHYADDSESWSTNNVSLSNNASLAWLTNYITENLRDTIHPAYITPGDINGDGKISIQDYIMLQRYLMNNSIEIHEQNADINGDNKITVLDLLLLKKALIG